MTIPLQHIIDIYTLCTAPSVFSFSLKHLAQLHAINLLVTCLTCLSDRYLTKLFDQKTFSYRYDFSSSASKQSLNKSTNNPTPVRIFLKIKIY